MPTCNVCGDENVGVTFHCDRCLYDECEACNAAQAAAARGPTPASNPTRAVQSKAAPPRATATPDASAAVKPGQASCLPLLLVAISVLAAVTAADVLGLMRVTETIFGREPQRVEDVSIAGVARKGGASSDLPYYEATPDRVWQTTARKPGNSRRASEWRTRGGGRSTGRPHPPAPFPRSHLPRL